MIGEQAMKNKHTKQMRKELTDLWGGMSEIKRRRYVGIIDSINLLLAHLDQEIQIAEGIDEKNKLSIAPQ